MKTLNNKIKKIASEKRTLLANVVYCWLVISLVTPNILLSFTENMTLWARVANILLPLGLIGLLTSLYNRLHWSVWLCVPLMFIDAFQIVLLGLYGRGIIAVDMFLNLATTNSSEAGQLLSSLWPSITVVCLLYLPPILAGIYLSINKMSLTPVFKGRSRRVSGIVAIAGILTIFGGYFSSKAIAAHKDLFPINVGYNLCLAFERAERTKNYASSSSEFIFHSKTVHPLLQREIVVLIIGETSRAENWQLLGYDRPTNPMLSKRNDVVSYPNAYTESNTTHKAVPMLLSPINAENFAEGIYETKSLITAFKEAGFHTAFVSNQMPNHSFIDFFGDEADETVFLRLKAGEADNLGDFDLLPEFDRIIREDNIKQLVVLHTYGSHFDYSTRFEPVDAHFRPYDYAEAAPQSRSKLINAYDNSIVATDRFLNSVIERLSEENCISSLLYSSDHGEDIYDEGSYHFLHASPLPTEHQVHVAMMSWLSPKYKETFPQTAEWLNKNSKKRISSSRCFCPTALSLGGIESEYVDSTSDISSSHFKSRELVYLNDHNESVPLESII